MELEQLGWNAHWQAQFAASATPGCVPARIVRQDAMQYRVVSQQGEHVAVLPGRWREGGQGLPAVGDWIAVERLHDGGRVAAVLPRQNWIARAAAGTRTEQQVLAANLDHAVVVTDGDDVNLRRLERYLVALAAGRVAPLIVVNKSDTIAEAQPLYRALEAGAPGVPAMLVSAASGDGIEALQSFLVPRRTVAFIGSSGVGKSTLVNRLLGETRQSTQAVRAGDRRGTHTTTRRELFALPGGALVIDTPGLRELAPWAEATGVAAAFADVEALAAGCRFRDCRHGEEPGCAVRLAVAGGRLDPGRLANFHKLAREAAFQQARVDEAAARQRKRTERAFGRLTRDIDRWHPKRRR